jgi:hypothetical protein
VLSKKVGCRLLGVEGAVLEGVTFDAGAGALIASVRRGCGKRLRCGECRRRCGRYDAGEGRRRWRTLDLGTVQA